MGKPAMFQQVLSVIRGQQVPLIGCLHNSCPIKQPISYTQYFLGWWIMKLSSLTYRWRQRSAVVPVTLSGEQRMHVMYSRNWNRSAKSTCLGLTCLPVPSNQIWNNQYEIVLDSYHFIFLLTMFGLYFRKLLYFCVLLNWRKNAMIIHIRVINKYIPLEVTVEMFSYESLKRSCLVLGNLGMCFYSTICERC